MIDMKVCIVGAGTAGLCSARQAILKNIEPTIFEQTEKLGGTWNYTEQIGTDKYGINIHTSMYDGLRTNLPKEIMGYPDFPVKLIDESDKSYIKANTFNKYLKEYAKHYKIEKYVKFLHYVIRIRPANSKWEVIVKNLKTNETKITTFDFIMVCNGHYHTPKYPIASGFKLFKGTQLHSHDFRTVERFQDQFVLVIGAGPSGMDLCNEISKVAKQVTLSHHFPEPPKTNFLDNVSLKGAIQSIDEHGVFFCDGSYEYFNIILYCTGYIYSFPFITADCGIYIENNYVHNLYKHCINIKYETMAFIGLPYYVCAAQMMDLQAQFVMKFYSGMQQLPSKKEMKLDTDKEMSQRWRNGLKKHQAHMMGPLQTEYYNDLSETACLKPISLVMSKIHNESSQRFLDDLLNFRNENFKIVSDEEFIKTVQH